MVAGVTMKAPDTSVEAHECRLVLSLKCDATTDAVQAALECGQEGQGLVRNLLIELSNAPHR